MMRRLLQNAPRVFVGRNWACPHGYLALIFLCAALFAGVWGTSIAAAQSPVVRALTGGPFVSPTRMVFEGRERANSFIIVNFHTVPITYRATIVNQRMLEDGSFERFNLPRQDELVASDFVLFSPRQFTLEPNQVQVVRVLVRRPADLAPGEYRSHLVFASIPPADLFESLSQGGDATGVDIQLIPITGVAVPLIVRQGVLTSTVSLSDLALSSDGAQGNVLSLRVNRSGMRSEFGDLSVTYIGSDGEEEVVDLLNGLSIYPPLASRILQLQLELSPEQIAGGRLRVDFRERADDGGAELASATLDIR